MNKIIAVALTIAAGVAGSAYVGLIPIWGYAIALLLSVGGVGALFFKKEKVQVIIAPPSVVPVELERVKSKKEQLAEFKAMREKRDNESSQQKTARKEEFANNSKATVDLDAVRAKLNDVRSGKALDEH